MNSQFKFKPDKIKYLSNVDTLDSSHKKVIENIGKKRDDVPKKILRLKELKDKLEELDNGQNEFTDIPNFIGIRTELIDELHNLKEELVQIENYEEETEYYSKTYQILFNYYDILDGQIANEININNQQYSVEGNNGIIDSNELLSNNEKTNTEINNKNNEKTNTEINNKDEWNFDGIQIFNSVKSSKLDVLNEMSKMKRKEKKTTRKRVKNVESLIKDNNYNIFDFIHSSIKHDDVNIQQTTILDKNNKINTDYDIYDRAVLYEDYKTSLEGYAFKKSNSKPCINCSVDKVLIYSEGMYACLKCGEVENCIVESEVTNYKDPMIEKPTFPYKRKNHFCEWIVLLLLVKVISKKNNYSLSLINN